MIGGFFLKKRKGTKSSAYTLIQIKPRRTAQVQQVRYHRKTRSRHR